MKAIFRIHFSARFFRHHWSISSRPLQSWSLKTKDLHPFGDRETRQGEMVVDFSGSCKGW